MLALQDDTNARIHPAHRILPPPPLQQHPVVEYTHPRYFSGRQLNELMGAFRTAALQVCNRTDRIPRHVFLEVLTRCFVTPAMVPLEWSTRSPAQLEEVRIDKGLCHEI